jgi:hypothetical protein
LAKEKGIEVIDPPSLKKDNADLISRVAAIYGYREVIRLSRQMQAKKKSFNPAIGKIKDERILVLQRYRESI